MAGPKGGRKGNRRNKGSTSKTVGAPASASVIPQAPTHSRIDYSKFDLIEDSSEEDEETVAPGCCCEKCRAGWPADDPDDEDQPEAEKHDEKSLVNTNTSNNTQSGKAAKSSSSFSFNKALGDAKKKMTEGKVARNISLQGSTHRFDSHFDQLSKTKSTSPTKAFYSSYASATPSAKSAVDQLIAAQNKVMKAYLQRKGHSDKVPDVVYMLDNYRKTADIDKSPNEAILRIFVELGIPIDITDAPSVPVALDEDSKQSPQSKLLPNGASAKSELGGKGQKPHANSSNVGRSPYRPHVEELNGKADGGEDSDTSTKPDLGSDDKGMPAVMPYNNDMSPVGSKPNGSHWTAPKDFDISRFTDGTSRLSTDPVSMQARHSEGVFTAKELFEGTGLFGATGPAPKSPAKKKPAAAKAAAANAAATAAAKAGVQQPAKAPAQQAPAKSAKSAPAKQADEPIDRLRQSYNQARKVATHTPNDDDDMLCSTESSVSEDEDDEDDASVVSLNLTDFFPGKGAKKQQNQEKAGFTYNVQPLSKPPQQPASQPKPKSTPAASKSSSAASTAASKDSSKPAGTTQKATGAEPLFREETRGPLASLYGAKAAEVAKATSPQGGQFFKGAFDKGSAASKQASSKAAAGSKPEAARAPASQGFNFSAAMNGPKAKAQANPKEGTESTSGSKASNRDASSAQATGAASSGNPAAYGKPKVSDQASGRANSAKNKYSPASATADSLKEEAHTKALARQAELEAEKAMRELLEEEEREKAEADKAKKEKQKSKKARRKAKKDAPKPAPQQTAEPAGRAEVDEVSDEEDDAEYPLDNRFFHLSVGVPTPSDAATAAGSVKNPQPNGATAAPKIDQGSLQMQLGGAFSLLQNMGKAGQDGGAKSSPSSPAIPVLQPGQSPLQWSNAEQQAKAWSAPSADPTGLAPQFRQSTSATVYRAMRKKQLQAEAEAAAGVQHPGSTADNSLSDLQQARNMVAEHRRQAQTNVADSRVGPSAAVTNGMAVRPPYPAQDEDRDVIRRMYDRNLQSRLVNTEDFSANGPAPGAVANASVHRAVPEQQGHPQHNSVLHGMALSSSTPPPSTSAEAPIDPGLNKAVDELEVAMRLVDQDLLREAIRGGTAALFQAGTAPETASTVAQLRKLLRGAKPRLMQLNSRPASANAPAQPAAPNPPRSLSPASSASSSLSSQQVSAQAAQRQQHHQQLQQSFLRNIQGAGFAQNRPQAPHAGPGHVQNGPQQPQLGPGHVVNVPQQPQAGPGYAAGRPLGSQPQFAGQNRHQQPASGSGAAGFPGMQRPMGPSIAQGQVPPPPPRHPQGYQPGAPMQPPPPAGPGPSHRAAPPANRPSHPAQGGIRPPQRPYGNAGPMQQPPPPPRALPSSYQHHQMPDSARAALPAHLQQAIFATSSNAAPQDRAPVRQAVHVKTYQDDGSKYVQPTPFGATHKPQDDPDDDTDCVVCMDNVKNTVFVPCGHCLCCTACAEVVLQRTGTCPVCSTDIDSYCGTQVA